MEYFGLKLQTLRKKASMSQVELAELVGVSRQAISKWERAEALPDLYNAKKIAEVFGVTLDDLMDIEIKSIDKEKQGNNKTALAFLCIPIIIAVIGLASLFITTRLGGIGHPVLTVGSIVSFFLVTYSILYLISFYNLYIGKNTVKFKSLALLLNFILLIGYFVLLISSLGESSAAYIILMILLLAIVVLGIIGGFIYNPEYQEDLSDIYLEKHKTPIKVFRVFAILFGIYYLIVFGFAALTHVIDVPKDISYNIDIKESGNYIDSHIAVDITNEGNFFFSTDSVTFNSSDIERIEIYFDETLIHDSNNLSELVFDEESSNQDGYFRYLFDYDFDVFKEYGDFVESVEVVITLDEEVKTYSTSDYSISRSTSGEIVPIWVRE